jgi:hypothetical protein
MPQNWVARVVDEEEARGELSFGGVEQLSEYLLVPLFTGQPR